MYACMHANIKYVCMYVCILSWWIPGDNYILQFDKTRIRTQTDNFSIHKTGAFIELSPKLSTCPIFFKKKLHNFSWLDLYALSNIYQFAMK